MKKKSIDGERRCLMGEGKTRYCLDFAIFGERGKIDVECNDDFWYSQKDFMIKDNERSNYLTSQGWSVLRFGTKEINKKLQVCLEMIKETADRMGGIRSQQSMRKFLEKEAVEPLELL